MHADGCQFFQISIHKYTYINLGWFTHKLEEFVANLLNKVQRILITCIMVLQMICTHSTADTCNYYILSYGIIVDNKLMHCIDILKINAIMFSI